MDDIKESNAGKTGGTNGSVAGVGSADLDRGYTDALVPDDPHFGEATFEQQQGGFLKRPHGWER